MWFSPTYECNIYYNTYTTSHVTLRLPGRRGEWKTVLSWEGAGCEQWPLEFPPEMLSTSSRRPGGLRGLPASGSPVQPHCWVANVPPGDRRGVNRGEGSHWPKVTEHLFWKPGSPKGYYWEDQTELSLAPVALSPSALLVTTALG